ncbi:hypothetical protein [Kordia sp.]|uniref:hypothetical protein n=1 Tax=Kordia sp. TaxID=1965332 RepID=UPI0025C0733F|nr:hypothetical protein [Kordia sp.]MCH2193594.1 hypothetical protein [Kordia sp.]
MDKKTPTFQENPSKALPILSSLKSDTSKCVRDAVGNWLNDASKSQQNWVSSLCAQWQKGIRFQRNGIYHQKRHANYFEKVEALLFNMAHIIRKV